MPGLMTAVRISPPREPPSTSASCDGRQETCAGGSSVASSLAAPCVWPSTHVPDVYTIDAGRPASIVYTSGTWVLGHTQGAAKEDATLDPPARVCWRPSHEALVLGGSRGGEIRTAVIRPGIVYGGARGIIGDLLKDARNGLLRVVGDGRNHWSCIYDRDLADVYVRVAASPDASGIYHVNDCLLYTSDAADERSSVDLGGRRIIKK